MEIASLGELPAMPLRLLPRCSALQPWYVGQPLGDQRKRAMALDFKLVAFVRFASSFFHYLVYKICCAAWALVCTAVFEEFSQGFLMGQSGLLAHPPFGSIA